MPVWARSRASSTRGGEAEIPWRLVLFPVGLWSLWHSFHKRNRPRRTIRCPASEQAGYRQEGMVPKGGLEPPRVAPHAPQTCASANSATSAPRGQSMPWPRAACQSAAEPKHASDCGLAQPRVERVAYPLAEKIVGEHGDQDGQAGIERQPPRIRDEVLAVVQDIAPGRVGWLDTQAQEGQAGLGEDGGGNAERHGHEHRGQRIGQDVLEDDPESARPDGLRPDDEFALAKGEELGAH